MFIQSRHQIKSLSTTYSWRTQINRHQSQKRWWPFLICLSVSLINRHHDWSIRVLAQNSPISLINAWRKIQMNELISRLYWWVQNLNVRSDWVRFRNWDLSGLFWTLSESYEIRKWEFRIISKRKEGPAGALERICLFWSKTPKSKISCNFFLNARNSPDVDRWF